MANLNSNGRLLNQAFLVYFFGKESSFSKIGTLMETVLGYLMPAPVFSITTLSLGCIQPRSLNFRAAKKAAAPQGKQNYPRKKLSSPVPLAFQYR